MGESLRCAVASENDHVALVVEDEVLTSLKGFAGIVVTDLVINELDDLEGHWLLLQLLHRIR